MVSVKSQRAASVEVVRCHPNCQQAVGPAPAALVVPDVSYIFPSPFSFPFFYSKQKIVPNSLLLEGGNLRLLAECHKPQI